MRRYPVRGERRNKRLRRAGLGLEGPKRRWGASVGRDMLVVGSAYTVDDHSDEDYNEIDGHIYP